MNWIDKMLGLDEAFKKDFGNESTKKRKFHNIRMYFDMFEKEKYHIDDETWSDLDMDAIFSKLDRTSSSVGESILYDMLRNPLSNKEELQKRRSTIEKIKNDVETRTNLQIIFHKLGIDRKNTFMELIQSEIIENKFKHKIYLLLGVIVPLITLILFFATQKIEILLGLLAFTWINIFINSKEQDKIKANGLIYLRGILTAAEEINKIKVSTIAEYSEGIGSLLKELKEVDRATKTIKFSNSGGGALQIISAPFLLEEISYYKMTTLLKNKEDDILKLYRLLGEIEAYISIGSFIKEMGDKIAKPTFIDNVNITIKDGIHPLINDAVPNSITFEKRGIVLTGTNMAGKSTFLRMMGVNIMLAQSFNIVLAKKYEACFFNIVTSINPSDDVSAGKSYFMAEAEGLLRIIKALDKELPVFCPIDEIFRGTNPVERISASAEILKYINDKKSISIVATHDRELTEILKENYEFYYFSENVDKKGLSFDYKLKSGVSKTRNAIKLLDFIGYPKEVINKSLKRVEKL